jgi:hypothetical protein
MNIKLMNLAACVAWACVAISSASPASALVETMHAGPYATCSPTYRYEIWETCNGLFSYTNDVRFISTACSSGGCSGFAQDGTWLDVQYSVGRKKTTQMTSCNGYNLYAFGSCGC